MLSRLASNHKKIKEHTERIAKIKPFIATYNWERMIYPLEKDS